jgi:hypothetical protein
LSIGGRKILERGYCATSPRELAPGSHFQAARWYSALETRAAAPTLSFEKRGIPAKQEGF